MRPRLGAALAVLPLLCGCGGHQPPSPPTDSALEQAANSGRQSLSFGRTKQAERQYRQAFTLALARNDPRAIGDIGFDLALTQLAGGDAAAALATSLRTRDALRARAQEGSAELDLVQAAATHRLGRDAEADGLAARARAGARDPDTAERASYLRGLIADGRGDAAGLRAALLDLGGLTRPAPDWEADRDSLAARLDLLRGGNREAAVLAQQAANLNRAQLRYPEMAETLALAALAMRRAGATAEAARLWLQAGESAAARGDAASAIPWLRQASLPGADIATQRAALAALSPLVASTGRNGRAGEAAR